MTCCAAPGMCSALQGKSVGDGGTIGSLLLQPGEFMVSRPRKRQAVTLLLTVFALLGKRLIFTWQTEGKIVL